MHAMTIGSSLKGMLGLGRMPARTAGAHSAAIDEGQVLDELQTASDRLRSRLDEASLSRTELIALSVDLEPVARVLVWLRKNHDGGRGATRAQGHAIRLVDAALRDLYEVMYFTRPWRPYAWPDAVQAKLRNAQSSVAQAIVALRWARIGV
jgi:hypothetical protein